MYSMVCMYCAGRRTGRTTFSDREEKSTYAYIFSWVASGKVQSSNQRATWLTVVVLLCCTKNWLP